MRVFKQVLPLVPAAGVLGVVSLIGLSEYAVATALRRSGMVPLMR